MNPKLIKPVVFAILAVIVIVVLIIVVKKFLVPNDGDQTTDDMKDAIDKKQLNYKDYIYAGWAERLKRAMLGWGTNSTTIFDILGNLKNNHDWYALVVAFGEQEYDKKKLSLVGWFEEELDTREMDTVKKLLKNIDVTL